MSRNPSDDINRIIIGLGGQGSRVVNEVRKAVLEQGNGTLPPGLDFIAIDSDRVALGNLDSVPEDHRIHLAAPDDNLTETVVPWLPHEFRPKAGGGCGMQRLTGKAMYLVHRPRIMETVRAVARKLRQRTQVSDFMVVIVNAFGGGTGSGMAIDFSIDLRADLKEITGQDPLMFGLGILPSRSETIQRANGVAILKELHLLLSNKEPVMVGGRDHSNPFELYFLTGREVMGIERDEELLKSIVRFTIDLGLIPSTSRDAAAAGKGAGWVDLQDIRTLVKGAGHMFSTFGYYRAGFPADTLLEYFETQDKLEALRREMPQVVTDLDAHRQSIEDDKVSLAHLEEVLRLARERAARLRQDGVLGANRPGLAKLFAQIGRLEDRIEALKRKIAEAESGLPGASGRRETIEDEVRALEALLEKLKTRLLEPAQSRMSYTVPLTEEEISRLAGERHLVTEGNFRSVMEALGRLPDYHDKTLEVVGKNKILFMPLVNYRMSFHTAAAFPPHVLATLRRHGFVRHDAAGNPVVSDDHLWMVMAMLSSRPENVEPTKVSSRAFKEIVEGRIARRAEVKIVPSASKAFEVVVHSWMVGIQIAPIAPGYPPRLRELEWLGAEYDQVVREGGIAQHHAFLYGDPIAFTRLTSQPADRSSVARTNELVTEFWARYQPIDAAARWTQLPPILAEAQGAAEDLSRVATSLSDAVDEFHTERVSLESLDRLRAALAQGREGVDAFGHAFAEDADALRARLAALLDQLDVVRETPRDPERLIASEEIAAEALAAAVTAASALARLRDDLPEVSRAAAGAARDGEGDLGPRAAVRWRHAAGEVEARLSELDELADRSLDHVHALEALLQRAQDVLRARTLPAALPGRSALSRSARTRAAPREDGRDALAYEEEIG